MLFLPDECSLAPTASPDVIIAVHIFKCDPPLVRVSPSRYDLLILVLPHQLRLSQFLKVLVVLPELEVLTFSLEAGCLVEDAQVGGAVLRAKILDYRLQELFLSRCEVLDGPDGVHDFIEAILLLDVGCEKSIALLTWDCALCFVREPKVIYLILLKARHECALTLIQDELGEELTYAKHVDELDDVNLLG